MTEEEKYNGVNLPEIHNYPAYWYRILSKLFFIFTFGLGSVILSIIIFPVLRIFIHPKIKFQVQARKIVSASFRFFCFSGMGGMEPNRSGSGSLPVRR